MKNARRCFAVTALLALLLSLLIVSPAQAQSDTAYIIVHALNPEDFEIASIEGMAPDCVQIYDSDTLIAYGAHSAETHNVPIAISPGVHAIRVQFNGMTLEQNVNLQPGKTKALTFKFSRTIFDIGQWLNNRQATCEAHIQGATHLYQEPGSPCPSVWSDTAYDHSGCFNVSALYSAWIYEEAGGIAADVAYDNTARVTFTGSSYSAYAHISYSCLGDTTINVYSSAGIDGRGPEFPGTPMSDFASPTSQFAGWFVQSIKNGCYPSVQISALSPYSIYEDLFYDTNGGYQLSRINTFFNYQYYSISSTGVSNNYEPCAQSCSIDRTVECEGSIEAKMSSVPYYLTGTVVKDLVADFKIYPADDPTPGQYKPAGQTIPMVGGLITFDATDSTGYIVMYRWNFGDKGKYIVETYEPIVNHIFEEEKTYHVTLEVVDSIDNVSTKTMDFTIPKLQPGDILFCCTRGYEFIPGFFTHCGIYIGHGKIVETVYGAGHGLPANGVGISDIMEWSADHETAVAVYRPMISAQYVNNAVHEAKNFAIQKPHITYDLNVLQKSQTPDSYYCSELVWAAYSLGSGGTVMYLKDINHWTDVSFGEINLGYTLFNLGVTPSDIAADPRLQYVAGHWEDEPGSPN